MNKNEQQLLIGVTGTERTNKRETIRYLAEALGLRRWQMQQPIIDAMAGLTGYPAEELMNVSWDTPVPTLKAALRELASRLHITTRMMNNQFLISSLAERMHRQTGDYLFNGNIIGGITTPVEAAWLRARGGLILHLINQNERPHEVPRLDEDAVIEQTAEPSAAHLQQLAEFLRSAWHCHQKHAA